MLRSLSLLMSLGALAAVGLAACGSAGGLGGSSAAGSKASARDDGMLAFAKCMRKHGVDMPDPKVSANGKVTMMMTGRPGSRETMERAQKACRSLQGAPRELSPQEEAAARDRGLKIARCIREHGIDMPDPGQGGGPGGHAGVMRAMRSRDDPAFERAMKECGADDGPVLYRAGGPK